MRSGIILSLIPNRVITMQELEKKILDLDQVEKKTIRLFMGLLFVVLICASSLSIMLQNIGVDGRLLAIIIIFIYGLLTYPYLLFHFAKCPYCRGHYFIPSFMMKVGMKKIIRDQSACIKCARQAKIISRYLD